MTTQQHALAVAVEERLALMAELVLWHRERRALGLAPMTPQAAHDAAEFRVLNRIKREAKRATREAQKAWDRQVDAAREARYERIAFIAAIEARGDEPSEKGEHYVD